MQSHRGLDELPEVSLELSPLLFKTYVMLFRQNLLPIYQSKVSG